MEGSPRRIAPAGAVPLLATAWALIVCNTISSYGIFEYDDSLEEFLDAGVYVFDWDDLLR